MIRIPIHLYIGEAEAEPKTHVVEIGETLFGIAKEYKATLGDLVEWNNLKNPDTIFAGQKLIVIEPLKAWELNAPGFCLIPSM